MLAALALSGLAAVGFGALTAEVCAAAGWLAVLPHAANASPADSASAAVRCLVIGNLPRANLPGIGRATPHFFYRLIIAARHTFVTVLSHSGVPIKVISDAVGHINSSVTREVYRHQLTDQVSDAARVRDHIGPAGRTR